jgi:hypothetical protein
MTYTPVLPTSYQSDRQDLNDALEAIVDAFIQQQSYTIGRKFLSEVPDSFTGEGPLIVLGDITETHTFTDQTHARVFAGAVYYIDWITDREAYNNRVNAFADHMSDLFEVNRSTVNGAAVLAQVSFQEGELRQGQLIFGAPQLLYEYRVRRGDQGGNP